MTSTNNATPSPDQLRTQILQIVAAPGYKPLKAKGFVKQLGLPPEEKVTVRRMLKRLVKDGLLSYGKSHLVYPPNKGVPKRPAEPVDPTLGPMVMPEEGPEDEMAAGKKRKSKRDKTTDLPDERSPRSKSGRYEIGIFRRKPSGIGFVRLKNVDPENPQPDIYVAAHHTMDAATGDTVKVELLPDRPAFGWREGTRGGRRTGRDGRELGARGMVVEVVQRATDRFVGTYYEEEDWGFVRIDGDRFPQPLVVGDPSATTAQPGDKVVVEMLVFPTGYRHGEAVIVEVLGPHGVPGLDTLVILREFDLPDQFGEETLAEARQQVHDFFRQFPETESDAAVVPELTDGRIDVTGELIVTIDPADAKDFDDAISLEKTAQGNWRLGVHIADVSHFVRNGGAIDREAKNRGTSVYLPDRVIPMLPELLSNALASLQPSKNRLAKSVYIELTPEGLRTDVEIHRTLIRSTQRFNYTEVQQFLDKPGDFTKLWKKEVRDLLSRMHELAMTLRQRRFDRGAVEMNMPEVKIDLDDNGQVVGAHEYPYYDSNRIIEEFMLAANEAVAEYLFRRNILFLRRVHRPPVLKKMKAFADFIRSLEIDDLDPEKMAEDRYVLQKLLDKVKGTPEEKPVNYALLRSMQRAEYSPNGEGHYALASDCYCHFTSPIRRYPDLTVHRLIDQVLSGTNPQGDRGFLIALGEHCSDRERRAEAAENELIKLKLIDYLSKHIGMRMEGIVTGIEPYGFFVQGIELPAEGLVRLETLRDDFYRFDRATHTLSGARVGNVYRLGDRVQIEVVRADADNRQIDFRVLERLSKPRGDQAKRTGPVKKTDQSPKRTASAKKTAKRKKGQK